MVEELQAKVMLARDSEKAFEAIDLDRIQYLSIQHRYVWKIWPFGGEEIGEKSNMRI
jgi:hypothetical protein